jgi:outer membrane protein insertion porin family
MQRFQSGLKKVFFGLCITTTIFFTESFFANDSTVDIPDAQDSAVQEQQETGPKKRVIQSINLVRHNENKYLTNEAILNRIPLKVGQVLTRYNAGRVIKQLDTPSFDFFNQIIVKGTPVGDDKIDMYIILYEQDELFDVVIAGNKHMTVKEIEDEVKISEMRAINDRKLSWICQKITNLYRKKDYHFAVVTAHLEKEHGNKSTMVITIDEKSPAYVKRVYIEGNKNIPTKKIKESIPTREDWLLSWMNKSGSYQEENIDLDKRIIEQLYKMYGYINAKVVASKVEQDEKDNSFSVRYTISEGEQYCIGKVSVDGKDLYDNEYLRAIIPIQEGMIYSHKAMYDTLELLKNMWGVHGYIFADVQPEVVPDMEGRRLNIHFATDLASKVKVRRITVVGNKKTRDYVVRRKLAVREGDLLTKAGMDHSKDIIEGLGYFEVPDGVTWKTNKISDELVDLDLVVKEKKTGKVGLQWGYGGAPTSRSHNSSPGGFNIGVNAQESNLLGWGITTNAGVNWSSGQWNVDFNIVNPYFRKKPIYTEFSGGYSLTDWTNDLSLVKPFKEHDIRCGVYGGYVVLPLVDAVFRSGFSFDFLTYSSQPTVVMLSPLYRAQTDAYQSVITNLFPQGNIFAYEAGITQNLKNHTIHATRGYQWTARAKFGFSDGSANVGYCKMEADFSWYTPLIGESLLVFGLHMNAGRLFTFEKRNVPFQEVYHIGGPTTVRGFDFGQISPTVVIGDVSSPIGAKKSFYLNCELLFPIMRDFTIKGCLFYDGGAGWDAPGVQNLTQEQMGMIVRNNGFHYRHSIGFGIRMTKPQPLKIDWGLKLDRKRGEPEWKVDFSQYYEF